MKWWKSEGEMAEALMVISHASIFSKGLVACPLN